MSRASEETPPVIYLIPDDEFGHVFCEDPAPNENMDPDAAVKYVRSDYIDRDLLLSLSRPIFTFFSIIAGFALTAFFLIIWGAPS